MTATPPPLEVMVGVQVNALRLAMGMTLSDLAAAASLSAGMLSKIENGQTSPSLASALNIPIGSFFKTFDEKRDASFLRAGEGLKIERRGSSHGHRYELLGHGVRGEVQVEPFLITLDEAADAYPIFQHEGTEFIHMQKGEVSYAHGDQVHDMGPGDSAFFDAGAPRGPDSTGFAVCDGGEGVDQAIGHGLEDFDGFCTFAIGTRDGFAVVRDPIACKPAVIAETDDWVAMSSEFRAIARLPGVENAEIWEPEPGRIYSWNRAA